MGRRKRRKKKKSINKGFDYTQILSDVAKMQIATQQIMPMVREQIEKGWKQIPNAEAKRSPKTWFYDPLTLQYSLGYKDRRFNLTYGILKRTVSELGLLSAIINTRIGQVTAFAQPYRLTRSLGYVIKHKDSEHKTTTSELAFIKELESFIQNCGRIEPNPYSRTKRDDFDDFLKKIVRDSLTYDQMTAEIVPDRLGVPYEFYAVDASTIRLASDDRYVGINSSFHERVGFVPSVPTRFGNLYDGRHYGHDLVTAEGRPIEYVQVINGQIENVYDAYELAFGVRNPRTDIYIQGYGYGEVEQIITIITSHLYAEQYNKNFFSQGSSPKGMLNLKGDNWTQDTLEDFQRQWAAQAAGVENSWKTPILQSEGIEWIDLNKTNQEMEFGKWIEYLIKITCGVYMIDPAEVNFDMHGGVQQTPLFESSQEWKLKASRDKGLKPLLKFLAKFINRNIIDRIDDHFMLEFVGLDELSENEKHEMLTEQISAYLTLNEARRKLDLPDLEYGDVPMNPVYFQAMEAINNQQAMAEGGMPPDDDPENPEGGPDPAMLPGADPTMEEELPQYSNQFNMTNPMEAESV